MNHTASAEAIADGNRAASRLERVVASMISCIAGYSGGCGSTSTSSPRWASAPL